MTNATCDGCGRTVTAAGGVANVWSFDRSESTGGTAMTLEFEDGSSFLLCYPCLDELPEEPTPADVEALDAADRGTEPES